MDVLGTIRILSKVFILIVDTITKNIDINISNIDNIYNI